MQMSAMSAVMAGNSGGEDAGTPSASPEKEIEVPLMEGDDIGAADEGKSNLIEISSDGKDADAGGEGKENADSTSGKGENSH